MAHRNREEWKSAVWSLRHRLWPKVKIDIILPQARIMIRTFKRCRIRDLYYICLHLKGFWCIFNIDCGISFWIWMHSHDNLQDTTINQRAWSGKKTCRINYIYLVICYINVFNVLCRFWIYYELIKKSVWDGDFKRFMQRVKGWFKEPY